jgi:DNA-binding transcriptional LysR family regulator
MRGTQFAELSAFVAVAEEASFTKAAKRLGLSTATLSGTVRSLEEQLGVRLLNRTTRSVAPTAAGERMLAQLRPLLDGFDAALESINAFRDKPTGHLRLTAPAPVAKLVLAPMLARFLAQYPEITIEISVEDRLTDIVAERYDAGFRRGRIIARDMIAVRVTDDARSHVVASPNYLARRGRPLKPVDLQVHNCIRLRLPSGDFFPWEFVAEGKTVELPVDGSMVVNNADLQVSAALEGIGVIYMLEEYVQPALATGSLVSLLDDSVRPPREGFFLYYPSRRQNPAALQALIEFFRKESRGSARAQASQRSDSNEP